MEVIVDASAFLAVVLDEPEREPIISATEDATLIAPEVLPYEIGNALVAMERRGRLEQAAVLPAWEATRKIPVQLISVDINAALMLALAHRIYAYDAYYLHCSLLHRRPLVTLDREMRAIAEKLNIKLLV